MPNEELSAEDFDLILETARGTFAELVESIYEQWRDDVPLSDRQIEVIQDAVERCERRKDR